MEKTSTTKLLVAAILGVLVLGGGWAMYQRYAPVEGARLVKNPTALPDRPSATSGTSLRELLAKTEPTHCTVRSGSDTQTSDGDVYVSGGKMRTDFTSTVVSGPAAGKKMVAHMIVDDTTSYMWGDGEMKFGLTMAKKDMLEVRPEAGNTPTNKAAMDMNERSDYECGTWTPDESFFVPPADISFQDMSKIAVPAPAKPGSSQPVPNAKSGVTDADAAKLCGACDQAGAGREQCRIALGCK